MIPADGRFLRVEFAFIFAVDVFAIFGGLAEIHGKGKYDKIIAYIRLDYAWHYTIQFLSYDAIYKGFRVLYYGWC